MTYPKRTIDLEVGDILRAYGASDEVVNVHSVDPTRRYTAVSISIVSTNRPDEDPRFMSLDNGWTPVELPRGHKLIAVPIEED